MIAPLQWDTATRQHPALESDREFASLLWAPQWGPAHLQRERQRVERVLTRESGWGFCTEAGLTLVRPLPWDEGHFGYPCADLCRFYLRGDCADAGSAADALMQATVEEARRQGVVLLSARIPASRVELAQSLERHGLSLVDTSVELGTRLPLRRTPPVPGVTVRGPRPDDQQALAAIAATFVGNRFHRDPRIPVEKASGVYAGWAVAAMKGDHGRLLLAEADGQVAGLSSYSPPDDELGVGQVALVVIAPGFRGRRVIDPLMDGCARELACEALVTSTQVSNSPALRAFGRHGLLPFGARHIFHGWLD